MYIHGLEEGYLLDRTILLEPLSPAAASMLLGIKAPLGRNSVLYIHYVNTGLKREARVSYYCPVHTHSLYT
jgi:hypothetical protein